MHTCGPHTRDYPSVTGTVFAAQDMACSGTRKATNMTTPTNPHGSTPLGVYSASDIQVGPGKVNLIDVIFAEQNFDGPQKYELKLDGCVFVYGPPGKNPPCMGVKHLDKFYSQGHWVDTAFQPNKGSALMPAEQGAMINDVLHIHWCPDQNYFLVKFGVYPFEEMLPPLKFHPTMFAPVLTP